LDVPRVPTADQRVSRLVPALDPRLLRRARPARTLLAVDAAIGVVAALLVLCQALLIARIVARSFDGESLGRLAPSIALLAAVFAARAALAWGFEVAGRRGAATILSQLRLDLVAQRLRAQPAALDGTQSSEVASLAVSGVGALETAFARYLPQLVLACVVPVAVLAVVAALDPISAGILLLTLPLVPLFMWLVGRYTAQRAQERWQALAVLSAHFLDVVRGLPTLRAFNRGAAQKERLERVGDEYRRATMGTLRVAFLSGAVLELAATLGVALVAVTVGVRLVDGSIPFETALAVLVLAPELYAPLRSLAAQYHASADGLAVTGRLLELIETPPLVADGPAAAPSARGAAIRLEDVSFAYPSRDASVLDGVELELRGGETVALVGESGGGKSTIAALLLRLCEPARGRVTVGGVDLAGCDAASWRAQVAWTPQDPTLFRGTVADNIRLGDPAAPDERVRDAARLAGADAFVAALPLGYETVVGEGGRRLSAGERRRIGLARAFLRDAPLLVLDEPTANLDHASVEHVADAVERLRGTRTIFVISHRAELAVRADRVVELRDGRILEAVPA
ncbi:MAG TPA: thiol reductant ABC exporter subunit CydD, partial [Gaiellaceae bacterium]|nr:thiol reductant ABC exporter subunit CydD [Gaiellaceae bacterium]